MRTSEDELPCGLARGTTSADRRGVRCAIDALDANETTIHFANAVAKIGSVHPVALTGDEPGWAY